jgi:hypothetical protein
MKESYRKGLANHPDPESCCGRRKAAVEALTGAHAGRVLSFERNLVRGADVVGFAESNTASIAIARCWTAPRSRRPLARMETLCAGTERPRRCPIPTREDRPENAKAGSPA